MEATPSCNRIGLTKADYSGRPSTLCKGCGHDSITAAIIQSYYDLAVAPYKVMKFSGIGCSSKTPTYFIDRGHGFNTVHGRMPAVATGAKVANHKLDTLGVSGDGDTASIGMGQFVHLMRRNLDMTYIIENNGVYGLTKGQFSATADEGSKAKKGSANPYPHIDCAAMAIELGATFVGRSFSGDRKQMMSLIKAAHSHKGIALLDIISPCVTFNNHEGSTMSYLAAKDRDRPIHELGYRPPQEEIQVEIAPGEVREIELQDGSSLTLKKLHDDFDPTDKMSVLKSIDGAYRNGHVLTGLLYFVPNVPDFTELNNLGDVPLCELKDADLDPGPEPLKKLNAAWR